MKNYRVTISYQDSEQNGLMSTTVPANNEREAIEKVKKASGFEGKVISEKAELLKSN